MAKHTPAPWRLQDCPNGGLILVRAGGDWKEHPQSHLQILPESDARLIAAAPEMVELLQAIHCDTSAYQWHKPIRALLTKINGDAQ